MKGISSEVIALLLTVFIGLLILFVVIRSIKKLLAMLITEPIVVQKANRALLGAGITAAIIYLVFALSHKLDIFAVLIGAIGAGLTFSLQQVILCIIGWISLIVGRYYIVGDRIQIDEVSGDVIEIGLLKTTLVEIGDSKVQKEPGEFYRGRIIQIPNSRVLNSIHYNFTQLSTYIWDELVVTLDHKSNDTTAREVIKKVTLKITAHYQEEASDSWKKAARSYQFEISEGGLDPQITLEVDEQGLRFSIRYLVNYRQRRLVRNEIYTSLLAELPRAYGQVVVAQQILRFDEVPVVRIHSMD